MNDKELAFEYIEDMANRRPEEEGDHAAPSQLERNFCPRCGKRTKDSTTIHTCTPPRD